MKLSKQSEYALAALVHLARQPAGTIIDARELATASAAPIPFMAKILQRLAGAGVARSHRGRVRGYALARDPGQVSVRAVLEAIEGPDLFQRCIFWQDRCSILGDRQPCVLHDEWLAIRPAVAERMERLSVAALAASPHPWLAVATPGA